MFNLYKMWCVARQFRPDFYGKLLKNNLNRKQCLPMFWLCSKASESFTLPDQIKFPNGDQRLKQYLDRLKESPTKIEQKEIALLTNIVQRYEQRLSIVHQYTELVIEMTNENEKEILSMANDEKQKYSKILAEIDETLVENIILLNDNELNVGSFMVEVQAGVGGQEAMLFARELFEMYEKFLKFKRWPHDILEENVSDTGGIRSGSIVVRNGCAFELFQNECGVHRVQRVPKTEKSGRIHTSTAVVLIVPCPNDIDINFNSGDLRIETKRSNAPGGQNVNKLETAVRIVHLPTGIAVEAQEERTQLQNKAIAMKKLHNKLYQIEFIKQSASQTSMRKSQIGARSRNEKVRTYNYPQKRVTDHRLGSNGTIHNLDEFLNGNEYLNDLMKKIHRHIQNEKLDELLN